MIFKQKVKGENQSQNFPNIDYNELGKLYKDIKIIKNKCTKAEEHYEKNRKKKKIINKNKSEKIKLDSSSWYQKFHWWITKNNFLVVGGKNSDDNEKIVKTYMKESDYYFL